MKKISFLAKLAVLALPFSVFADGYGMMDWGYGMMGGFGYLAGLTWIVWTLVGIFAAIWLWQQINKK